MALSTGAVLCQLEVPKSQTVLPCPRGEIDHRPHAKPRRGVREQVGQLVPDYAPGLVAIDRRYLRVARGAPATETF